METMTRPGFDTHHQFLMINMFTKPHTCRQRKRMMRTTATTRCCRLLLATVAAAMCLQATTAFIVPLPPSSSSPASSILHAASSATTTTSNNALDKYPIVIFPAQFGIAADYKEMIEELNARGHPAYALDLSRFDWLKITKSAITADYWKGTLKPKGTLDFFFEAADSTIAQVKADFPTRKIHLVAHSIGGWVARAYCGEVADPEDVKNRFVSLTTLGSPNYPPPPSEGGFSLDQTRGLLDYVNNNFPGAYHKNFRYVSVGGVGTPGKLGGGIEESVAFISYLPLCGNGNSVGDGIIPEEVAFLEGATHVRVPEAKHSGFIPTAGPSIKIPGYTWYGSAEVLDQWLVHLPEKGGRGGGGGGEKKIKWW